MVSTRLLYYAESHAVSTLTVTVLPIFSSLPELLRRRKCLRKYGNETAK